MTALVPNLPDLEAALASNDDALQIVAAFRAETIDVARTDLRQVIAAWDTTLPAEAIEGSTE